MNELLRLNPNDNQGNRWLLVSWLLESGRDDEASELLARYEDDASANERHLRRLLSEYVAYYHDDRTHDALAKDTPAGRRRSAHQVPYSTAVSQPRLGGLHHRYEAAA